MLPDLDVIDPTFVQDLGASQIAVRRVAGWLSNHGQNVVIRGIKVRPCARDLQEFADAGDLEILSRIEVKHRPRLMFTSAADYPFPTLIVDVTHTWDRAAPKPFAYIILNAAMTTGAIVAGRTWPQWTRVTRFDKGRNREFYECPIALARFIDLAGS